MRRRKSWSSAVTCTRLSVFSGLPSSSVIGPRSLRERICAVITVAYCCSHGRQGGVPFRGRVVHLRFEIKVLRMHEVHVSDELLSAI
eukprot:2093440-Rhodomonas_salina.2